MISDSMEKRHLNQDFKNDKALVRHSWEGSAVQGASAEEISALLSNQEEVQRTGDQGMKGRTRQEQFYFFIIYLYC